MRIFANSEERDLLIPCSEDQIPLVNGPELSEWREYLTSTQIEALPLATFPIIDDFEIALTKGKWMWKTWRYHLALFSVTFFSQQRGYLVHFGSWGHIVWDFLDDGFHPLNFWDREQSWHQIIFEKDEYVYFLEGDDDDGYVYHTWFRVRKERYVAEWQLAIEACRLTIHQAADQ